MVFMGEKQSKQNKHPETNSKFTPKNGWLEYVRLSYWVSAYFQVRLLLV